MMVWSLLGWCILGAFMGIYVPMMWRPMPYLDEENLPEPERWPQISVVVPARDEAADIERCLKTLLASDYPALEIIAVNDRSQDTTGQIMERLAAKDERLKVLQIQNLPEGWLGKNHAVFQGVKQASGEYLLFSDGDIFFAPDVLTLAMRHSLKHDLDHFCLFPNFELGDYFENLFLVHFGLMFFSQLKSWRLENDPKTYVGIGAFMLVRRSLYEQAGGHQPLAMEVIDDVMLGKLLKRSGARSGARLAGERLTLRWHRGIGGLARGLEKNAFAAMRYSLPMLMLFTVLSLLLFLFPYLAIILWQDARAWGYFGALALMHFVYLKAGQRFGQGWHVTFGVPLAIVFGLYIFWRSALKTCFQKGIYWRDQFYSLKTLKTHRYR